MPKVSFIMPAYKAAYLKLAIESIVAQSCGDWELVVVDDCSPEHLDAIVSQFDDARITYHRNESNIGGKDLVAQWNHSIGYAKGEWIVLAADDDLYHPDFCATIVNLAEKYAQVDLIRSRVEQIDEYGAHLWDDHDQPEYRDKEEYFTTWMNGQLFDCIGNFAFRASALRTLGGFVGFPCAFGSDIATPVALSLNGVAGTGEMLFKFRQSSVHLSSDASRYNEKLQAVTQMYSWFGKQEHLKKYASRLHGKCVYDYFNLVVKHVDIKELPHKLSLCALASPWEKTMMVARWMKRRICNP